MCLKRKENFLESNRINELNKNQKTSMKIPYNRYLRLVGKEQKRKYIKVGDNFNKIIGSGWTVELECCFEMYISIPINVGTCKADVKYVSGQYSGLVDQLPKV